MRGEEHSSVSPCSAAACAIGSGPHFDRDEPMFQDDASVFMDLLLLPWASQAVVP